MSYRLERRDGEWHVVGDDGSSQGVHAARTDAIKHQRALYAQDSRVASMYAELDAQPDPDPVLSREDALTVTMLKQAERMSERQASTDQAFVAALPAIGSREPVVNFHAPAVTVEQPAITVEAPNVTVEAAQVNVPAAEVTFHAPDVNVTVEAPAPVQKTVTFERDPLTQQVTKAEVVET